MNAPEPERKESVGSFLTLDSIIAAARRADPNFRYAIVAAGLVAVVAIIVKFGVSYATLIFGVIALVGLMVLFVVFAQIPKLRRASLDLPARVLVWTILLAVIAFVALLTTSTFFNWPLPFRDGIARGMVPAAEPREERQIGPSGAGNFTETPRAENGSVPAEETIKPIDATTKALIVQDVTDAYKQVGWQIAFINNWGQPPTRQTLRVVSKQLVGTSQDGRAVGTPVDPDALPAPQYYGSQTIAGLGQGAGPRVTSFYAAYGQYRAALKRLNEGPVDFLAEFTNVSVSGNEVMKRGREALCALGKTPPVLFPQGGFLEPVPPNCDGLQN